MTTSRETIVVFYPKSECHSDSKWHTLGEESWVASCWLCRTPYFWLTRPISKACCGSYMSVFFEIALIILCSLFVTYSCYWGFLSCIYCISTVKEGILFPSIIAVWVLLIFLYVKGGKKSYSSLVDFWTREQQQTCGITFIFAIGLLYDF